MRVSRREALRGLLGAAGTLAIRLPAGAAPGLPVTRFGLIADIHQDVMPDGVERVGAFVAAMTAARVDFVLQLGDFCQPRESNRAFLVAWNAFAGPRYHVLGNHDMDGGFRREQAVAFNGMPARYYTFDGGAFLGVVLDGNDPGGKAKGYKRFIAADQLAWLEQTLAAASQPVLVFVHQPLEGAGGVENGEAVRGVLRAAAAARPGSVLAVLSGHLHEDYLRTIDGIPYVMINSASYYWVDAKGQSLDYFPAETHRKFPHLRYVAAYRDPLWVLVEVDRAAGELRITGRRTEWVGPPATERGVPATYEDRPYIRAEISDQRIALR